MKRAIRNVIRLLAVALVVFGGIELGLELMRRQMQKAEIRLWPCLLGLILIAGGAVLFWASARIAERLTEDFEE
jgi:hypothetical protein